MLEIVGAIYDAALQQSRWAGVLERIDDAVGGRLLFGVYDPANGLSSLLSPRIDPERVQNLLDWAPRNPLLPLGRDRAPGDVFTIGDFISREQFARSDFYNEWWEPAGFDAEPLTTNLLADHHATGILTCHRPAHLPPYDHRARRLFATLAQHLVRAVAIQRRMHQLDLAGRAAVEGVDELKQGLILTSAAARPLFLNRRARELTEKADGIRLEAGQLDAADRGEASRLRALIASCSSDEPDRIGGTMSLRRPQGHAPLRVQVSPVGSDWAESAGPFTFGCRPTAMLLITDPESGVESEADVGLRRDALRQRFGLTRAEAAFAIEIVKGGGRKLTAERLGITDGTARSHLSRIFHKTGVSRQAELVRLLLRT